MESLLDQLRLLIGKIRTYPNSLSQPTLIALLIVIILFISGSIYYASLKRPKEIISVRPENSKNDYSSPKNSKPKKIIVYICGTVKEPGVYQLNEGERVIDAIERAGGALPQAELEALNLASKLNDGQKIYLPKKGEIKKNLDSNPSSNEIEERININQADSQQIEQLSGIGPVLAERITKYREEHGFFKNIDELKKVEGIGPKKFENLKDKITVD